jgi:hypothetical protein
MAQSASRFCPTCKSFFHGPDTCPTTFLTYQPVSNTLVDSDTDTKTADLTLLDSPSTPNVSLASELQLRAMVAEGTGNVRRSCTKHRLVQLQLTRGDPARRQSRMTVVLDAFDEDCVVNRSLLPVCSTCMHAETGLQEKDLASGLDMCRCATLLVEAECFNCLLCEINGALKCALLKGHAKSHACAATRSVSKRLRGSASTAVELQRRRSVGMMDRTWILSVVLKLRPHRSRMRIPRRILHEWTCTASKPS